MVSDEILERVAKIAGIAASEDSPVAQVGLPIRKRRRSVKKMYIPWSIDMKLSSPMSVAAGSDSGGRLSPYELSTASADTSPAFSLWPTASPDGTWEAAAR